MTVHTAQFTLHFATPAEARVIHDAVAVESDEGPEGTRMVMALSGGELGIALEATDVSGLRAAMHSALRLIDAAQRTTSVGRNG